MVAACVCSDMAHKIPDPKEVTEILAVVDNYPPRLMSYFKTFDGKNVFITAVDKWVFEKDVVRGFLGEVIAGKMIFPFTPIMNAEYFKPLEIGLKKRLAYELLENLALDYPELSYEVRVEPEYFMYETMISRARVFPLLSYLLVEFCREDCKTSNIAHVFPAYFSALQDLERDGVISFSGKYVRISPAFVERVKKGNARFLNLLRSGQRALFASLLGIFPQLLNAFSQSTEFMIRFQRTENRRVITQLQPSGQHLFVPTENGLVSLSNKTGIEDFAKRMLHAKTEAKVRVEDLGGILNDVFLVKTPVGDQEKRIVAKRYRDWSNFKWFPLTLWSVGTRSFVVLGRLRLEREYAMNQLLRSKGFAVPRVLYVSEAERLIFMEHVEGKDLSEMIKKAAKTKTEEDLKPCLEIMETAGKLLAKVHSLDIALGDTKPENLLLDTKGELFLLDFEQASRHGDKVWDIAEFVYYTGHYFPLFAEVRRAELIVKAFIRGYLEGGGNIKIVKRAGNPKYTKVFSVFTQPHIMLAFSALCRKAD
jgi:tRNA A-37 threonylcarbamoyl transferase component Bud32